MGNSSVSPENRNQRTTPCRATQGSARLSHEAEGARAKPWWWFSWAGMSEAESAV